MEFIFAFSEETSCCFDRENPEYNEMFIRSIERYYSFLIERRAIVPVSEIVRDLGMEPTAVHCVFCLPKGKPFFRFIHQKDGTFTLMIKAEDLYNRAFN